MIEDRFRALLRGPGEAVVDCVGSGLVATAIVALFDSYTTAAGLGVVYLLAVLFVHGACDPRRFDEVVVSTLPTNSSRWLLIDLPHRVARITGATVTHVAAPPELVLG